MVTSVPYFICVFAVLINKASPQVTVEGFIDGSALLPCSSTEDASKQDIYVHWRDDNGKIVFDLMKGEASIEKQDKQYKNRVESFPQEYLKKNFSIKLNELQHTDAGKYICYISHSSEQPAVRLIINASVTENGSKPLKDDEQGDDTGSNGKTSLWLSVFIPLAIIIIIIIIVAVLFLNRKKRPSDFSPVTAENTGNTEN